MYTKCIPHFDKLLYAFCIQILVGIVLLILYTKCIQKFVEIWDTFCIHLVYILHTSVVNILYNFCIQNVYMISMWKLGFFMLYIPDLALCYKMPIYGSSVGSGEEH